MQEHIFKLGLKRLGFFDPQTGLNLSLDNPQGTVPADYPLSQSVKAALVSGGLINVNGSIDLKNSEQRLLVEDIKKEPALIKLPEPEQQLTTEEPKEESVLVTLESEKPKAKKARKQTKKSKE